MYLYTLSFIWESIQKIYYKVANRLRRFATFGACQRFPLSYLSLFYFSSPTFLLIRPYKPSGRISAKARAVRARKHKRKDWSLSLSFAEERRAFGKRDFGDHAKNRALLFELTRDYLPILTRFKNRVQRVEYQPRARDTRKARRAQKHRLSHSSFSSPHLFSTRSLFTTPKVGAHLMMRLEQTPTFSFHLTFSGWRTWSPTNYFSVPENFCGPTLCFWTPCQEHPTLFFESWKVHVDWFLSSLCFLKNLDSHFSYSKKHNQIRIWVSRLLENHSAPFLPSSSSQTGHVASFWSDSFFPSSRVELKTRRLSLSVPLFCLTLWNFSYVRSLTYARTSACARVLGTLPIRFYKISVFQKQETEKWAYEGLGERKNFLEKQENVFFKNLLFFLKNIGSQTGTPAWTFWKTRNAFELTRD